MKLRLNPSDRKKKRYFLVRGSEESVRRAFFEFVGVLGVARAELGFVRAERAALESKLKKGELVVCVNAEFGEHFRAAVEVCSSELEIVRASGTLKSLLKGR